MDWGAAGRAFDLHSRNRGGVIDRRARHLRGAPAQIDLHIMHQSMFSLMGGGGGADVGHLIELVIT